MKLLGGICILVWAIIQNCHGAPEGAVSVEKLVSSIQESFMDMSTRRDMWKLNYDTIRDIQNNDQAKLLELQAVSMYAVPFLWTQYVAGVDEQRKYGKLYESEGLAVPRSQSFEAKGPYFNVELHVKILGVYRVEISNSKYTIVGIEIDMREKKVKIYDYLDGDENERIILSEEMGDFPSSIQQAENTQINIQVADDCTFVTFWSGDLKKAVPQWLGPTYHFCSQIYEDDSLATYNVNISDQDNENEYAVAMTIFDGIKSF